MVWSFANGFDPKPVQLKNKQNEAHVYFAPFDKLPALLSVKRRLDGPSVSYDLSTMC